VVDKPFDAKYVLRMPMT